MSEIDRIFVAAQVDRIEHYVSIGWSIKAIRHEVLLNTTGKEKAYLQGYLDSCGAREWVTA